jgi:nitrite reductase/ring-hydroxylating ferredoxin subunit
MTASPVFEGAIDAVEGAEVLDAPAKPLGKWARTALARQPLKDALSGTWLGHAVHPLLTDVVIGTFLSSTLLDVLGGDDGERAQRRLVSTGIAAAAPTVLTGVNDWADAEPADDGVRRAGLVHAVSNATALALYAGSLAGSRRSGAALRLGGAAVLLVGGYIGGHLTLTKGVGPAQTVYDPGPEDWTAAGDASALRDGHPARVVVDDTPVLLLRDGDALFALHDRCSHRGCSLSEGSVEGDEIVCGCHGSRFDRRDGSVRQGPATSPQPAFEVRVRDERVEIRRRTTSDIDQGVPA